MGVDSIKIKNYNLMNVLFVCSRNLWRSPTAEEIYKNHCGIQVRSAGTESSARIKLSAKTINWADLIFVMEKKHKEKINANFPLESENKRIIILEIYDDYKFMDPELIDEIRSKVEPYFV